MVCGSKVREGGNFLRKGRNGASGEEIVGSVEKSGNGMRKRVSDAKREGMVRA